MTLRGLLCLLRSCQFAKASEFSSPLSMSYQTPCLLLLLPCDSSLHQAMVIYVPLPLSSRLSLLGVFYLSILPPSIISRDGPALLIHSHKFQTGTSQYFPPHSFPIKSAIIAAASSSAHSSFASFSCPYFFCSAISCSSISCSSISSSSI